MAKRRSEANLIGGSEIAPESNIDGGSKIEWECKLSCGPDLGWLSRLRPEPILIPAFGSLSRSRADAIAKFFAEANSGPGTDLAGSVNLTSTPNLTGGINSVPGTRLISSASGARSRELRALFRSSSDSRRNSATSKLSGCRFRLGIGVGCGERHGRT